MAESDTFDHLVREEAQSFGLWSRTAEKRWVISG
jgi:hypothetical protein